MTISDSELDGIYRRGLHHLATRADLDMYPVARPAAGRPWLRRASAAVVFVGVAGAISLAVVAGHEFVGAVPATSAGSVGGAAATGSVTCSTRTQTDVYREFRVEPPGTAQPKVSCATAVASAEAHCPLNVSPCPGSPMPQTAQLSVIKDYPYLNAANPGAPALPRLVWEVTWTAPSCGFPTGYSADKYPSKAFWVDHGFNSSYVPASRIGATQTCHWVTFVDAVGGSVTGKNLWAAMEFGCARIEGPVGTACGPLPPKGQPAG